jgi:lysophospholipase L1-like esterase
VRRAALGGLLGAALFCGTGELAVRQLHPRPRAQIVRHDTPGLRPIGDTVTWRLPGAYTEQLENARCPGPDTRDVLLVGDSVLYVTGPASFGGAPDEPDANVATRLQAAFVGQAPPVCVLNLAQPGLLPQQLRLLAQEGHARVGADLLVVAVWKDARDLTEVGGDWYDVERYQRPPGGLPTPWSLPAPQALHRALFDRSALWEYASLTLGRQDDETALRMDPYTSLLDDAEAAGLPTIFVEFAPLDRPFADGLRDRMEHHRELERQLRARGAPYLLLGELLADQDVTAVRADTCCHLNARGHAALAEALRPVLAAALDAR